MREEIALNGVTRNIQRCHAIVEGVTGDRTMAPGQCRH